MSIIMHREGFNSVEIKPITIPLARYNSVFNPVIEIEFEPTSDGLLADLIPAVRRGDILSLRIGEDIIVGAIPSFRVSRQDGRLIVTLSLVVEKS